MKPTHLLAAIFLSASVLSSQAEGTKSLEDRIEHGFANNGGVKIHYVALGQGPLVVMIHGFPDYWYSWRHQMEGLSDTYRCIAVDQRGYNMSDKPEGVENYDMKLLVEDVAAVIRTEGATKASIVGHDWGGMVAWSFAMAHPEMTERLVILNLPHPNGLIRELVNNPEQQKNAQYARNFQKEGAEKNVTPEFLAFWVKDPEAKKKYVEAFRRSDIAAMLNYYRQNYPKEPYTIPEGAAALPKIQMPVLEFHGLKDKALLPGALNGTWEWLEKDWTLVTIPDADHFVQQDAAELVTKTMKWWLGRDAK